MKILISLVATFLLGLLSAPVNAVAGGDDQSPEVTLTREPMGYVNLISDLFQPNPTATSITLPFTDEEGRYFEFYANLNTNAYTVTSMLGPVVSGTLSQTQSDILRAQATGDDRVSCYPAFVTLVCAVVGYIIWDAMNDDEELSPGSSGVNCDQTANRISEQVQTDFEACMELSQSTGVDHDFNAYVPPLGVMCTLGSENVTTSCTPAD